MSDLIFLGLFAVMMTSAFVYVRVCDRIVGPLDNAALAPRSDADEVAR